MMTKAEREELGKLLRQRAKVAHKIADQKAAELEADVEAQLARIYEQDEDHMHDLVQRARDAAGQIDQDLAKRCHELGIPASFRPRIQFHWAGRGQNGFDERRRED